MSVFKSKSNIIIPHTWECSSRESLNGFAPPGIHIAKHSVNQLYVCRSFSLLFPECLRSFSAPLSRSQYFWHTPETI